MKSKFELTKEQKSEMTRAIKAYFEKEQEEQIGDLKASLLLDFFMEELAPMFYNLGVEDSHQFLTEKLDDLYELQK